MGNKHLALSKPWFDEQEVTAVRNVLEFGWVTEGPVTKQFEQAVADYVGAKYAVATTSCTTALELCLKAYDIKDDVLVPDFTFPATANAVMNVGATPILVDVHLNTYNVDVDKFPLNTSVTIPVSWGGNPIWSVPYTSAIIIEDAACSLGAESDGVKIGSKFTTCFSFHATKNVTSGEGGVITTNDAEIAERLRSLKNFGQTSHRHFVGEGSNCKMSDVNAAIGLAQMQKIDMVIDRRIEMAETYNDLLTDIPGVRIPQRFSGTKHTYQCYAVYLENGHRDEVISRLAEKDMETQIGTYALHLLPLFRNFQRVGSLENSTKLYHNLLRLPMAYDLTDEDQQRVVTELKEAIQQD